MLGHEESSTQPTVLSVSVSSNAIAVLINDYFEYKLLPQNSLIQLSLPPNTYWHGIAKNVGWGSR